MTIAVIMMTSSVAYVNTFDMPYTAEAPIDEILERRMGELLAMTREWPLSSSECGATTKLEELLLEGVSGEHEAWEPWHDRFAQDGFELAMLLDNRHAKLGLHGRQDFVGVTRDVYYPDDFHRTTLTSGVSTVSGVEDLPVESVSIRYGHLVRMKGEAVQYQVQFETVGSSTQKDSWTPTALLPSAETAEGSRPSVQDFAWVTLDGQVQLRRELHTSPVSCGHTESIPEPTGLSVHAGGAVVMLQAPHQAHFWQGDDAGRGAAWTLPPEQAPTRARWGRWVTSDVVAVGDISGALRLFGPDPDAPPLFESRPSDRLAIGSFYFPVPEGGFLGTHVFRALVTWSQGGKTQTASLMDWFEVVPPDGVPEERSEYRIALVGEDRARPRHTG